MHEFVARLDASREGCVLEASQAKPRACMSSHGGYRLRLGQPKVAAQSGHLVSEAHGGGIGPRLVLENSEKCSEMCRFVKVGTAPAPPREDATARPRNYLTMIPQPVGGKLLAPKAKNLARVSMHN